MLTLKNNDGFTDQKSKERYHLLLKKIQCGGIIDFAKSELSNEGADSSKTDIALSVIAILCQESLVKQVADELVAIISKFVSFGPPDALWRIAQHYVVSIKQSAISSGNFEVLGNVMLVLAERTENICVDGEDFTPTEYRSHLVNNLCSIRWNPGIVLPLGRVLLDLCLSEQEMSSVIHKITSSLSLLKLIDVPQMVHFLLVAASKGCHKPVVSAILQFFGNLPKSFEEGDKGRDPISDLTQAEGTSLLHISFAVKHDQELGKAFIQQIKCAKHLTHFTLGLALSLIQHDRFSEQVLTAIKSSIVKSIKSAALCRSSKFVSSVLKEVTDIDTILRDVLKKSNDGWDHVTEGLIKLGFTLLDSHVNETGSLLLEECYKLHMHCRKTVLTELLNKVVTSTPLTDTHYTTLLIRICRRSVQLLLSQSNKLKDDLSNIPLVPKSNARAVIQAIVPVMRYDSTLRDAAILVFRKSLYSKNEESRRIAVSGMTEMMKKFKVGENYSQGTQLSCSQVQVHLMVTDDVNEAVCTEIMLLLKRGLSQQGVVRSDIYDALPGILSQNYKLYPMILTLIDTQLSELYESDQGILPPIKLGDCLSVLPDQTLLREPVMNLVRAAFKCSDMIRGREPEDCVKLDDMLESIITRTTKCDLEDWDLDKSGEFSGTGVGSRNTVTALSLIATLEVILENVLIRGKGTVQSGEQFKKIFKQMYSVHELLNEKQGGRGRKSVRTGTPYFSLSGIDSLLQYLITNDMSEHEEFVGNLKTVSNLLTWTFGILSDHLKKVTSDPENGKDLAFTLGSVVKSLIFHLDQGKNLYREQSSSLLFKCIQTILPNHVRWVEEFCETAAESIPNMWNQLTRLFNNSIQSTDFTESQSLLSALNLLQLPCDKQQDLEETLTALLDCDNLTSGFARDVILILLESRRLSCLDLEVHLALSRDISSVCGDILVDEDESMNSEVRYKLINENSAVRVAAVVVSAVDTVLSDIECGVQQGSRDDDTADTLCQHLIEVAGVLGVMLGCKIPRNAPAIDLMSRAIKKFYNTFTLLVKQESARGNRASEQCGVLRALEQLAKLVGGAVNQKVYSFLIYLEQKEEEGGEKMGASTIRKQAVSVPGIVYAVEQAERNLIILSKKLGTVDLMENFKRSTARDFKIETAVLQQKLNRQIDESEADKDTDHPKKKKKTS